MKTKIFIMLAVLSLLAIAFPSPALAFTGVSGTVFDSLNNDPWIHGGHVYILGPSGQIGDGPVGIDGTFSVSYDTNLPSELDTITVLIILNHGGVGQPSIPPITYTEYNINAVWPLGNILTGTGPNAIELRDFTVSQPATQNTWLPYVLLVGSVILVSGTITILRKRRA